MAKKKTTTKRSRKDARNRSRKTTGGKPRKLAKDTYPEDGTAKGFACFGPAATVDGDFDEARICDMGCFTQDGKDSNKYYHGAVVQHRKSKNWYAYFEWGRTGGAAFSFQFVACDCEADAHAAFAKQMHAKNDKRGEWVTIAGIRTLRALQGKDCYLVRPMATRTTGLPDARKIKVKRTKQRAKSDTASPVEPNTLKLMHDLRKATIAYTRKSMADSSIPTRKAIEQARTILAEAQGRVAEIENDVEVQAQDKQLNSLTRLLFSRIPHKKKVGAAKSTWVLSAANIQEWNDDLDAFESALLSVDDEPRQMGDVLREMNLNLNWLAGDSKLGQFLHQWCPAATANRHAKIDQMAIKNVWEVDQHSRHDVIPSTQKRLLQGKIKRDETPLHQPRTRIDLPTKVRSTYKSSHTALLFHGTRGVNVNAILRDSLRMPQALVAVALTGAKFGPGIYFSDDWKKAADYTNAKGNREVGRKGAVRGRDAFMFIADVVLGTPHVAPEIKGYKKPPRGHHSVFGKAGYSGVNDNEFVVYKSNQAQLRYLVEFATI